MEIVKKKWGYEILIANEPEYCGKVLCVQPGGGSSIHRHRRKKETFFCISGEVHLYIERDGAHFTVLMTPTTDPVTIQPGEWHAFSNPGHYPWTEAQILEVSTHHDDSDVERRTQSYAASST